MGGPSPAAAQNKAAPSPDVVAVLSGDNKNATELSFVGRSGQIYEPTGTTWKRKHLGGIASDVLGAVKAGSKLYAVSKRTPMFRRVNGVWMATPLANRGWAAFSDDGAVIMIALGRHLYQLQGSSWKRFATAARRVTAIYPAAKKRVYVATTRGRLRRTDGNTMAVIKNPLPTDDRVVMMLGRPKGELYGVSKLGSILKIGASSATVVTLDPALEGLTIQVLGHGPKKAIYGAGVIEATDGSKSFVMVEMAGGAIKEVMKLPALAPGDRYTVVHTARDGRLVVAMLSGQVRIRRKDGTWEERQVSGEAPEIKASVLAPARSR
ncbi:MAG: hypothetical protein KJO07_21995 [Deltaproteobacteria bacterium]|nr:hypothetical protein [Deltaproteobacteria bacterium]